MDDIWDYVLVGYFFVGLVLDVFLTIKLADKRPFPLSLFSDVMATNGLVMLLFIGLWPLWLGLAWISSSDRGGRD